MAQKEPPKPLFALKHDFYASLDQAMQEAGNLLSLVEQAVKFEAIKDAGVARELAKQAARLRQTLFTDGE